MDNQYYRNYYANHKESYRTSQKKWYDSHKEAFLERKRNWYHNLDENEKMNLLNKRKLYYSKKKLLSSKQVTNGETFEGGKEA